MSDEVVIKGEIQRRINRLTTDIGVCGAELTSDFKLKGVEITMRSKYIENSYSSTSAFRKSVMGENIITLDKLRYLLSARLELNIFLRSLK